MLTSKKECKLTKRQATMTYEIDNAANIDW